MAKTKPIEELLFEAFVAGFGMPSTNGIIFPKRRWPELHPKLKATHLPSADFVHGLNFIPRSGRIHGLVRLALAHGQSLGISLLQDEIDELRRNNETLCRLAKELSEQVKELNHKLEKERKSKADSIYIA